MEVSPSDPWNRSLSGSWTKSGGIWSFLHSREKKSDFITFVLPFYIIKPILCFPALILLPMSTTNHHWYLWWQPGPASGTHPLLSGDLGAGLHWGPTSRHWCNWEWQLGAFLLQQAQGVPASDTQVGTQHHPWGHSSPFSRSGLKWDHG